MEAAGLYSPRAERLSQRLHLLVCEGHWFPKLSSSHITQLLWLVIDPHALEDFAVLNFTREGEVE